MIDTLLAVDFYSRAPVLFAVLWLATTLAAALVKDGATKQSRSAWFLAFSIAHWGCGLVGLAMIWPHR